MSDTTTAETAKVDAGFVGLAYVSDEYPGISRKKRGGSFRYVGLDGNIIRDRSVLQRIRSIVIPPAWMDVWISPSAKGHIQATGRDDRGRKQYRYHPDFRAIRDGNKYEHIVVFGAALVKLRRQVNRDMSRHGLTRAKVIATVVYLLDATLIRVGNSSYARENGSFGLTTLRSDHVKIGGAALRFEFKGKSGKTWRLQMHDRRVARIVKSCQDLPGQDLFQYVDQTGARASIGSAHVNDYLRQTTGRDMHNAAGVGEEIWDEVADLGNDSAEAARDAAHMGVSTLENEIKRNPLRSVLVALGVGFIVGMLGHK